MIRYGDFKAKIGSYPTINRNQCQHIHQNFHQNKFSKINDVSNQRVTEISAIIHKFYSH